MSQKTPAADTMASANDPASFSFLTNINKEFVKYKLANYEIQLPNDEAYNTQYEEAKFALDKAKLEYNKAQKYYKKRMEELDREELELTFKEEDLKSQTAEIERVRAAYAAESRVIEEENKRNDQERREQLAKLAELTDETTAAETLLKALEEREQEYEEYSKTILTIYNELTNENIQYSDSDEFANVKNVSEAEFYIRNIFEKLDREKSEAMNLDSELEKRYEALQEQMDAKQKQLKLEQQQFDTELEEKSQMVEAEKAQKKAFENEINQLNLKLNDKMVELSEAFTNISNLCSKIKFGARHQEAAENFSIVEIVGDNNKVRAAVEQYRTKSKNTVTTDEAYERILGPEVLAKLRDLTKLTLWIEENERIVALYQREKTPGSRVKGGMPTKN